VANSGPKLSTGLPDLDSILRGMISGDNVVWQVNSIEEYLPFVKPYCDFAQQSGIRLIYFSLNTVFEGNRAFSAQAG
jgi:hypothetical protein